jgi:hypothetical protein
MTVVCKVDQKYLESFEMCCWRRMENRGRPKCVRNEDELQRVKKKGNIF